MRILISLRKCVGSIYSQTGSMAQAAAEPLAVEFTWIDVLTLASERQRHMPTANKFKNISLDFDYQLGFQSRSRIKWKSKIILATGF